MENLIPALAQAFMELFWGLDRAHGTYLLDAAAAGTPEGDKVQGRPYTEHKPVTLEVWEKHLSGERGLGIIPITDDATVNWAAIDIDVYPIDFDALEKRAAELMLPLTLCRTKSGGAHLLLFCAEPIRAQLVRQKLSEWAVALGYPGCEIFPKQNSLANKSDVGNWLNMPYYNVAKTNRYAIYEGKRLKVKEFLKLANSRKVTADALKLFRLHGSQSAEEFEEGPPCLQYLAGKGFPRGGRNTALFNLAVFARMSGGDDWQAKVDTYNHDLMDPPLPTSEVMVVLKSASKKDYFFTCDKDPLASACNKELCRMRKYGIGSNSETSVAPVMLGSMSKINSDPPIWIIDVEGYRLEITSEELISQTKFRKLCMDKINKLPPLLKQPVWEAAIRERLANVEIVEAPPDAGPEGQFWMHLETFLTVRSPAANPDELLIGKHFVCTKLMKPLEEESFIGRTFFRSQDLLRYLEQQHFKDFKERQIWAMLRKNGALHHSFKFKGKHVTAWSIDSIALQSEEFDLPPLSDGDDM